MLNLSDKELDRLARAAASEYDPGDLTGPASWDRMQHRLDIEMGSPRFNLFRSFRRMSFYYAPAAIMLLAGVTYFLLRPSRSHSSTHPPGSSATAQAEPSGGPPPTAVNATRPSPANTDGSIKNQNSTYSPTSTQASPSSVSGAITDRNATMSSPAAGSSGAATPSGTSPSSSATASPHPAGSSIASSHPATTVPYPGTTTPSGGATSPAATPHHGSIDHPGTVADPGTGTVSSLSSGASASGSSRPHRNRPGSNSTAPGAGPTGISGSNRPSHPGSGGTMASTTNSSATPISSSDQAGLADEPALNIHGNGSSHPTMASPAPLAYSTVEGIRPGRPAIPVIDDSPLRKLGIAASARAAEPVNPGKPAAKSMHINRRLELGVSLSPEFTSVNSLAGDKPGSDIGITASYQFFSRLHLQTGFLLSHRNYTAAQQDYHVPYDYYRMNNMHDVYFVKGNLNLYEIPLNIRYDFSVSGNTSFFVSGGVSSYLLTHENCNYYFDLYGRPVYQEFQYSNHQNSLFGTVNLSMGVEGGLTNSLSFIVAPYMKLPTAGLGFGKIEMNSIGVEFGLRWSPVLRRRRH